MGLGRRRHPRVEIAFPVRVEDSAGRTWHGRAANLSLGGLKVETDANVLPGRRVRLNFRLPDGLPGVSAHSLAVRQDPNSLAFAFEELEPSAADRIKRVVLSLLPRQPLKVLVIEDEGPLAKVFSDFLRSHGHQPIVAESAEAGLELVDRFYPDLMIFDAYLPGMSGVQLLRRLRDRQPPLPSVVVSGAASDEEAGQCLEMGAFDVLRKPISLNRLEAMLGFLELQAFDWRFARGDSLPQGA